MANNLLIVFGGTTENTVVFESNDSNLKSSGLFLNDELDSNHVDVLQINVLTTDPSISFYSHKPSPFHGLNGVWVSKKETIVFEEHMRQALRDINDVIKKVDWGSLYSQGSDGRGMTVEQFNDFSRTSKSLILNFLQEGKEYSNILMLAHSRGCALALQSLSLNDVNSKSDINNIELSSDVLTGKLKRVVLLDPVSKNASSGWFWSKNANKIIPPANAKIVEKLSQKINKEIHIVSKAKSSSINYDSYVDHLVGTKKGNKGCGSSSYPDINMQNIWVHIADMAHEKMLSNQLRSKILPCQYDKLTGDNNQEYLKIIQSSEWRPDYYPNIKASQALQKYLTKNNSANELKPKDGDPLKGIFNKIECKDRRRAFVHCLANKYNSN